MQLEFTLFQEPASPVAEADPEDSPISGEENAAEWTESALLGRLRAAGARTLGRVVFRANRSTIWSLTRSGTALNLHQAFRRAPTDVVDGFAVIVTDWRRPTAAYRRAAHRVKHWPGLATAMEELRDLDSLNSERPSRSGEGRGLAGSIRCDGTATQRRLLRGAFEHFNRTRLDGLLPEDVVLRFSARMTRRLGQMQGIRAAGSDLGSGEGAKMEIALSIDLLLEGNEHEFVETLLHEMAHAADFVARGKTDHGAQWKAWARRVGCAPRPCTTARVRRRARGGEVDGVPPGLQCVFAGPGGSTEAGAA